MLFKLQGAPVVFALLLAFLALPALALTPLVSAEIKPGRDLTLPEIVRLVEEVHFGERSLGGQSLDDFIRSLPVNKKFQQPAGVFCTLSKNGKTRACWGTVYPQNGSIARATVYAALGALTKEYRFKPVTQSEWRKLKVQVTVITGIDPLQSIHQQNPLRDGLFVRAGGKAGVLLPGEATDAY